MTMALGLVCIQPQWTTAVDHIRAAMGFVKTDRQEVGKPRILTVDRPGRNKRRRQTRRLYKSFGYRDANSPKEQLDEYPPAVFLENYGKAHMTPIDTEHNRESGRDIKDQITGPGSTRVVNAVYHDGDQIEMHIPSPFVDSRLFCKDAF
ncbi:MAG: hypothetical protein V3V18_11070 [Methylococcales bacterium]